MSESGITGVVKAIIYEASDSLYKVIKVKTTQDDDVTVVGNFPSIDLEGNYHFEGQMTIHEKYGLQLKMASYTQVSHDSEEGIIAYLSSGKFKGIGEKTAKKIVDALGKDCIEKIAKNPDCLKEIKSIPAKKREEISSELKKNRDVEEIFVKLYSYGLSIKMAQKVYSIYEEKTLDKISQNPYCLITDVDGFGFLKADKLALSMGFAIDSSERIKQALIYTIQTIVNSKGFTFLTKEQLINSTNGMLTKVTPKLQIGSDIYEEQIKYLYDAESQTATRIKLLLSRKQQNINEDKVKTILNEMNDFLGFDLTSMQREAVFKAITNKVAIITGGPGTGKTTIVKALLMVDASLKNLSYTDQEYQNDVLLLAPTGKAAKRMGASTGIMAQTIHKALGYQPDGTYEHSEENPLKEHFIIIDESSMIDIQLIDKLLRAISVNAHLIFVGDKDQLPSVGPGNLLQELIESKLITTITLNEIMRQKKDSNIIRLSQMIKNQNMDYTIFNDRNEVYFYEASSDIVLRDIEKILNNYISKGGNLLTGMQILCPMYSGVCGIDAINQMIQERFNHNEKKIVRGKKIFKVEDRVLQLANDPLNKIMNGDEGIIKDIYKDNDKEYLYIDFDSQMVKYDAANLDDLTLGYAISIHKSQGSEYENVILPIVPSFYIMLKRKLIYTAVTRAKKKLIILGKRESLNQAIQTPDDLRQTSLLDRLCPIKDTNVESKIVYINDPSIPFDTLGEENMENITPYSFMEPSK